MRTIRLAPRRSCTVLVVLGCVLSGTAFPEQGSDNEGGLQEIVVTAQKRQENSQTVPIAVNVVTESALKNAGVSGIADIKMSVPSLTTENELGWLIFFLHGIGSTQVSPAFENPIALYVDDVYIANQSVGLFGFNNIAQVEVDKGPQGTLFGRNATGGLIQISTADPTQAFKAKVTLGASNYHGVDGSAHVSGGLASDLVADVAIRGSRRGGWGTNLYNGQDVYAVPHDIAVRSKWIYTPDDWRFVFIADYANSLNSNDPLTAVPGSRVNGGGAVAVGAPVTYPSPWDTNTNVQPSIRSEGGGVSLKAQHDVGTLTVSDIVAYRRSAYETISDYDATPDPGTGLDINGRDWQFSNELQLSSKSSGPLKWVSGLYYFRARGQVAPDGVYIGGVPAPGFAAAPAYEPGATTLPVFHVAIYSPQDTQAIATYAQGTYSLTDALNLTAGARYSYEYRSMHGITEAVGCNLPAALCPPPVLVPLTHQAVVFKKPTFRVALDYQLLSNAMLYASVNTGFKSGGFNSTAPDAPGFKPETITAYEIGEKAELLQRRLRVNSALFYDNYKDMQLQVAGVTSTNVTNGGSARICGLDTDITVLPVGDLEITASAALLHAEFSSFPSASYGAPGGGVPLVSGDATGNTLPHAPRATVSLGATYPFHFSSGDVVVNGTYYHNNGFFLEADNIIRQSAYNQFNASLTWQSTHSPYSIRLYGTNLSNVAVKTLGLTIPTGNQIELLSAPRTYGVSATYDF